MSAIGSYRPEVIEEIRKYCQEEIENPPVPTVYGDVPITYESITKEWLTTVLAKNAAKGTAVKAFTLGLKDDGTANRRRIEIVWEGPDANADGLPTSIFCKAAQSVENRVFLYTFGGTYGETCFYNDVRPTLNIEAPRAYYAEYNPKSWAAIWMLQDMGDQTVFCNHKIVLSKTQHSEQIKTLARLHGTFYESKEPFFERLITYKESMQNLINLGIDEACRNGFRAAKEKGVIPPRLAAKEDKIWPVTLKSIERNASLPSTLAHTDVHLGNWYITPDGHMGLTDWQTMSRSHWSRDLAYVITTGTTIEHRRLWEREMVQLYVTELEQNGGPRITVEEAWLELRRQSFGALAYWTLTLRPLKSMPDMQPEAACLDFIERISTLIDDHDALEAFDD